MPAPTRRFTAAPLHLLLLLAAACGGGGTDPAPPPPPPPPPPGPPATVLISAGDGQQAAPGAALTIAPTVVVRDASNRGVPGVTVSFAVDSGGGAIASPSATTDAGGVASAGTWTLGPEGHQVLLATVGALPPAKVRATSRIPTVSIGTQTMPITGGTITVGQAGALLNGLTLTFPDGALQAAAPITLSVSSTAGITLPAGIVAASPALVISSTAGPLREPAIVQFPFTSVPGQVHMLAVYNPVTRHYSLLQPLGSDATSITAVLPGLDGSLVSDNPPTAGLFALRFAPADDPVHLLTVQLTDPAILADDYDSGFRPQQDNWDFDNFAIAWLPFLAGTDEASPAEEVIDPSAGMVATSLWYFGNRKATDGPLYGRFREQPDQAKSNRRGIRWAALANRFIQDPGAQMSESWREWLSKDPALFTKTSFQAVKAMFYNPTGFGVSPPVPVLLWDHALGSTFSVGIGVATQTIRNGEVDEILIVLPDNKETAYRAKLTADGLQPFTVLNRDGSSYTVELITPLLLKSLINGPNVGSQWSRVVAGTVGDAEGWPTPELHWEKAKIDTEKPVFIGDLLLHWWECPSCEEFQVNVDPSLPATASHVQATQMTRITGGVMAPWFDEKKAYAGMRWRPDSIASDTEPTLTGHIIMLPQPAVPEGFPAGWLDWQTVTYRKMSLRPTPAAVELNGDETVVFTLDPSVPPPAGTTWSWVLRTDSGRDSAATAVPSHSRDLKGAEEGMLLIMAHEAETKRIIGRDSVAIAADGAPFWRITEFDDLDGFYDPGEDGAPQNEMEKILANHASGLIGVIQVPGGSELRLWAKAAGVWTDDDCCPPTISPGDEFMILGAKPEFQAGLGPFFTQWRQVFWLGDNLSSGPWTARGIGQIVSYNVEDGGVQMGPYHATQLVSTAQGKNLVGTITLTLWHPNDDNEVNEESVGTFRFQFTAVRLR